MAIGDYHGILISLDAVVHSTYQQCDTTPYIGSIRSWSYAGMLSRLTTKYIWHQEVLRTGGMERNEVRPPVSHIIVYQVRYISYSAKSILYTSNYTSKIFSGVHCSMETWIIRVGTRDCTICMYCCCITRICSAMYNTQSNTARKWHGFSAGIEIDLVVVWVVEVDEISNLGIGVGSISA